MKIYKGNISKYLPPHQIFVFGSNTEGRHGKGAAKQAKQCHGAIYGQPHGRQGQSFAIVTKDLTTYTHPSVSMYQIMINIEGLYRYAIENPNLEFLVAYSGLDTNLNGYTNLQMAKLFYRQHIPENIVFEENFAKLILS